MESTTLLTPASNGSMTEEEKFHSKSSFADLSMCLYLLFSVYRITPPKFNIAPENLASQKERIVFQPSILNGRYVKLWGVYMLDMSFMVIMLLKVLRLFKKPIDQNQCLLNQKISNGCLSRQWETFASLGKNQSQRMSQVTNLKHTKKVSGYRSNL